MKKINKKILTVLGISSLMLGAFTPIMSNIVKEKNEIQISTEIQDFQKNKINEYDTEYEYRNSNLTTIPYKAGFSMQVINDLLPKAHDVVDKIPWKDIHTEEMDIAILNDVNSRPESIEYFGMPLQMQDIRFKYFTMSNIHQIGDELLADSVIDKDSYIRAVIRPPIDENGDEYPDNKLHGYMSPGIGGEMEETVATFFDTYISYDFNDITSGQLYFLFDGLPKTIDEDSLTLGSLKNTLSNNLINFSKIVYENPDEGTYQDPTLRVELTEADFTLKVKIDGKEVTDDSEFINSGITVDLYPESERIHTPPKGYYTSVEFGMNVMIKKKRGLIPL